MSLVLATLSVVLPGCGGGGNEESDSPLTHADFVRRGNTACYEVEQKREEVFAKIFSEAEGKNNKELETLKEEALSKIVAAYDHATKEIAELPSPQGDERQVEALIDAREVASSEVHQNPATAFEGDLQFREANKMAADYGLMKCVF